jgi:uncharacterized protein
MEEVARRSRWVLTWEGVDVSKEISPLVLSVEYTDELHGRSDGLDLTLCDSDARWRTSWYPTKGDKLDLKFGWEGEALQSAGLFEVDEAEFSGPPSTFHVRALGSGIKHAMRQKRTIAYDGVTLKSMADKVAARHGLTVVGDVDADLRLGRVTQHNEGDLAFLKTQAENWGHAFTVRGNQLVFHKLETLRNGAVALVLTPSMVSSWRLFDRTLGTAATAKVIHDDPKTKTTIQGQGIGPGGGGADNLVIVDRVENVAQADVRAQTAVDAANNDAFGGQFTMPGEPRLAAGVKVQAKGFGRFDRQYVVTQARHSMRGGQGGGFTTMVEIRLGEGKP